MAGTGPGVHVDTVTKRHGEKVYRSHLLRRSVREGRKVKKVTIANITCLGDEIVGAIRQMLKGRRLAPADELFEVVDSVHHGHVQAVLSTMKQLGLPKLVASRRSRERDLVVAMVAARVLEPDSKLATTRWWHTTSLPEELGVSGADEGDLYAAMDWLLGRQRDIEKKLAARHLNEGSVALYDLSSSYFEGDTCPLAALGYNRDRKKGKKQVNWGLLTDGRGCPVAISVFKGNTGDTTTLMPQVHKLREDFGLDEVVLVGDRGMISGRQVEELSGIEGVSWIAALRPEAIKSLIEGEAIQLDLFDERDLFELSHPDFPGERLVACRNVELAKLRAHKRLDLVQATARELDKVVTMVAKGRLEGADAIGLRVGKVVNKYKVAKHFDLDIADDRFDYSVADERVAAEAALDGIYVIRTSVPASRMDADDAVRTYKQLSRVERGFRTMKSVDLQVRPIRHRKEDRVRAHFLLCMLAWYVRWHMEAAWRELLFHDEDQAAKAARDPVAPAVRSDEALDKIHTKRRKDGGPAHSFGTLLKDLATVVRNRCRRPGADDDEPTFDLTTRPSADQQRAFDLIAAIHV